MQGMETYVSEINGELVIKEDIEKRYRELKTQKDEIDKELKKLSTQITSELREHVKTTTKIGGFNVVVKGGYYDYEFDLESFRNEHIDLYIKYLKPHESETTLQLTMIKETKDV